MVKAVDKIHGDLINIFTPEQWEKAREYWREGLVCETYYGDGIWQGTVTGSLGNYRVRVKRRGNRWRTDCSCLERRPRCRHAAALLWGWMMEPERFTPVEELTSKITLLSRTDAVEFLYRVAVEEAGLVKNLLAGGDGGKERTRVSLPGLLYLVKSLGPDTGSPWLNRQVWEERWRNLLAAVEEELVQGTGEAWQALVLLTEKMLDFCLSLSPGEPGVKVAGYTACLLELLTGRLEKEIPERVIEKLLDFYLKFPLSGEEEEKFHVFFRKLCAVKSRKFLFTMLQSKFDGEVKFPSGVRVIRLAGMLLPGEEKKEFQELAGWCLKDCRRLLPLLDLLEEKKKYQEAKELLQEALPLFDTASGRYLYRLRLAVLHRMLGENRQALYLGILNFTVRPGREEYFALKRLALTTGEWKTIKPRLFQSMTKKTPALLKELDLMGERILSGPT